MDPNHAALDCDNLAVYRCMDRRAKGGLTIFNRDITDELATRDLLACLNDRLTWSADVLT